MLASLEAPDRLAAVLQAGQRGLGIGQPTADEGEGDVVAGWKNKLQSAIANLTPAGALAATSPHGRAGVGRERQIAFACDGAIASS